MFASQPTDQGYSVILDGVVPVRIELLSEDQAGVRHSLLTWRGPITGDMSLSYLPTAGAQAYLNGDASPESVALWTPILGVGGRAIAGRPFAADGSVVPAGSDGGPLFQTTDAAPVPLIRSLKFESVDASNFPRVEALVRAEVTSETAWRAHFLQLSDNGKPAQVRIVEQPASVYGGRTIVFVIDNSGSMAGHLDRVGQIMYDLIDRLGPGVRVGMTHTEDADRLAVTPRFLTDKAGLKAEIEAALKPGGGNRELTSIRTVLREVTTPVDIILVGDGELDNASTTGLIRSMVEDRDSRIYSILVTGKPDLYRAFSTEVWSALPGQLPEALTARLTDRFSDRLRIAWTASGNDREGREVTLASSGWRGGTARANYRVEAASDGVTTDSPLGPGLILSVNTEAQDDVTHLRRIVPLEGPHAARALTSVSRISLVPGLAPDNAVMAANLDLWHAIGTANQDGGRTVPSFRSGPSFMAMARSNALLRATMTAYGDALYLNRPLVLVERISISTDPNGNTKLKRTLDVMNPEVLSQRLDEPRPWRVGLAIAAGEGAALGVDGVSPAIRRAARPTVVGFDDPLPPRLARIAEVRSIHGATREGRRILVTAESAGPNAWVIGRGGFLEVRAFDPAGKGANAEQAIAEFKRQKANLKMAGVLWSGLATPYGVPGAPLGGVVGILEADRKLWCYSSVMMGYVADDIAGANAADETDPLVWKARAQTACELDPERFGRELGMGIATGAISNQITDNILTAGNYGYRAWQTGSGGAFDLTDSISAEMSVLIAAGLSASFEYGHVNDRIGELVGATLP